MDPSFHFGANETGGWTASPLRRLPLAFTDTAALQQQHLPHRYETAAAPAVETGWEQRYLVQQEQLNQENESLHEQVDDLQQEMEELRQKLRQSERKRKRIEDQQEKKQQQKTAASESIGISPNKIYGRREKPISTEEGFIDGRSNAAQGFEQKLKLLREYKAKHGHCNVPQPSTRSDVKNKEDEEAMKINMLGRFIKKQRLHYRYYQEGKPTFITPERIKILEEIGVEWVSPAYARNRFHEVIWPKLKAVYQKFGHTCIDAIPADDEFDESFIKEYSGIVKRYRSYLKNIRIDDEKKAARGNGKDTNETDHSEEKHPGDDGGDEEDTETNNASNEVEDEGKSENGPEKKRGKRSGKGYFPLWFREEAKPELEKLNCDWLNMSFNDEELTSQFRSFRKSRPYVNTVMWYKWLEVFRKYVADHDGNGLIVGHEDSNFTRWVSQQRALHGSGIKNPILERNYALLEKLGFVFEKEAVDKEIRRIRTENQRKRDAEKARNTPLGKLNTAEKELLEVTAKWQAAKQREEEAKAETSRLYAVVKEARKTVETLRKPFDLSS